MGCGNVKTATVQLELNPLIIRNVKETWPEIKKIDDIGAKTFAHLLFKHPELKSAYNVPEAFKTEAELFTSNEVTDAGKKFISSYSEIIKGCDDKQKLVSILQSKADEFRQLGVKSDQVKYHGESLIHVAQFALQGKKLQREEKESWHDFNATISKDIAANIPAAV